ncbi:HAD-IC family P-type ATPase, partial [Streptomyces avidinii]
GPGRQGHRGEGRHRRQQLVAARARESASTSGRWCSAPDGRPRRRGAARAGRPYDGLRQGQPGPEGPIVRALQADGHTVGFLGDGINDAAALRDADVGISVDTAVDIAKESADIILLEKDLTVLEQGVIHGRTTFGNTIKYIKMTASSNFGNVFSVLVASAFIPFQPMLAIMLLVQNLVYDISQLATPWDRMDEEYLRQPRNWDAKGIGRFVVTIGPVSSVFDISMFLIMWHVFGANSAAEQSLFQSGWFIEGLLSQTLIVHMIRTRKSPSSIPAPPGR